MSTKLYSRQTVGEILGINQNYLKHWVDQAKPEWYYVEPAFHTERMQKGKTSQNVKLWTEEQLPLIKEAIEKHKADLGRSREPWKRSKTQQREYNRRYYAKNREEVNARRREQRKAKLEADFKELESKAGAGKQRKRIRPKPTARPKPVFEVKPLDPDAQAYIEEFEQEREDKALQILMGIK